MDLKLQLLITYPLEVEDQAKVDMAFANQYSEYILRWIIFFDDFFLNEDLSGSLDSRESRNRSVVIAALQIIEEGRSIANGQFASRLIMWVA